MRTRAQGIGASLERKEDDRFLRGRGDYVANMRLVGMRDVAFVRSPIAHGRIDRIVKPAGHEHVVFTIDDLRGVAPIVANSALKGFQRSWQPGMARGKVRQVGEMIALCVADSRAEAEDLAALVEVDFTEI